MNQTLRRQISKLCEETQFKWVDILPIVLMSVRITPLVREGVSPLEILSGKLYPLNSIEIQNDQMHIKGEGMLRKYLLPLLHILSSLHRYINQQTTLPLDSPVYNFQPGNSIYIHT